MNREITDVRTLNHLITNYVAINSTNTGELSSSSKLLQINNVQCNTAQHKLITALD